MQVFGSRPTALQINSTSSKFTRTRSGQQKTNSACFDETVTSFNSSGSLCISSITIMRSCGCNFSEIRPGFWLNVRKISESSRECDFLANNVFKSTHRFILCRYRKSTSSQPVFEVKNGEIQNEFRIANKLIRDHIWKEFLMQINGWIWTPNRIGNVEGVSI